MRVEKLVGIRVNLGLFEPDTESSSTRLESGTEEEVSVGCGGSGHVVGC